MKVEIRRFALQVAPPRPLPQLGGGEAGSKPTIAKSLIAVPKVQALANSGVQAVAVFKDLLSSKHKL